MKLNHTAWWYTHNAPHGLEQPGGAAWGTTDIDQGPMEFFLTVQNHRLTLSYQVTKQLGEVFTSVDRAIPSHTCCILRTT